MRKLGLGGVPHFNVVDVFSDDILEVDGERAAVLLDPTGGWADALGNVEDDGGEAVLVDIDFLVVGDLAQLAHVCEVGGEVDDDGAAIETGGCVSVAGHFVIIIFF